MGYDLHITRRPKWHSSEGQVITEAEWRAVVDGDAEMWLTGSAEHELPGGRVLAYSNPALAEWTGHPDEEVVWFDHRRGNIVIKNPDEITLLKIKEIARRLKASVQGDDGESY